MKNLLFVHLNSGLGNMLFQIAAAYAYSIKHNKNLIFHDQFYTPSIHQPISSYLNNIFSKLNFRSDNLFINDSLSIYKESVYDFLEIPNYKESLVLDGYFQSPLYFREYKKQILEIFNLDYELNSNYLNFLDSKTCSIHIRLGDYLKYQNNHPIQSIDYYKSAVKEFDSDTKFLIFSDDTEQVKKSKIFEKIGLKNTIYIENQSPQEDLKLMSLCKNNIICNSTFSWWAGYLNKNINKKIIYPKKWFTESYAKIIKTSPCPEYLFPENWQGCE
jgi:hypothetical protein